MKLFAHIPRDSALDCVPISRLYTRVINHDADKPVAGESLRCVRVSMFIGVLRTRAFFVTSRLWLAARQGSRAGVKRLYLLRHARFEYGEILCGQVVNRAMSLVGDRYIKRDQIDADSDRLVLLLVRRAGRRRGEKQKRQHGNREP